MKKSTLRSTVKLTAIFYIIAIAGIVTIVNSCSKKEQAPQLTQSAVKAAPVAAPAVPLQQNVPQTKVVTVANIRLSGDGSTSEVMFNELAELFTVKDATVSASLKTALSAQKVISIQFDPWSGVVLAAQIHSGRQINSNLGTPLKVDLASVNTDVMNSAPAMAILNTTATGLTNVVPDMATAQLMFDYITKQCCANAGPYGIDYCISFQYCEDGCYARAHKMCWIINNVYHYNTHKIFSFANAGSDELCVKCEKWRGCCVNWWYHVAPLVNIKTTTGIQAFVFDPAMFDQPVLLATWLHAQTNPTCVPTGDVPHVSMINIQPTSSYSPSSYSGYSFDTDPTYSATDGTLTSYAPLHTCY